tara:strand:+ start:765 stop:1181 length:417 start_codon:yes stop_codon:yes gene_type:complete
MKFYILQEKIKEIKTISSKYLKFMLAGLPGALFSFPLNFYLVEFCGINISFSYGIVLFIQITLNFFFLNKYVFNSKKKNLLILFIKFLLVIFIFRFLDWFVYTLITFKIPNYYLLIQLFNILLFSIAKFKFSKLILEK